MPQIDPVLAQFIQQVLTGGAPGVGGAAAPQVRTPVAGGWGGGAIPRHPWNGAPVQAPTLPAPQASSPIVIPGLPAPEGAPVIAPGQWGGNPPIHPWNGQPIAQPWRQMAPGQSAAEAAGADVTTPSGPNTRYNFADQMRARDARPLPPPSTDGAPWDESTRRLNDLSFGRRDLADPAGPMPPPPRPGAGVTAQGGGATTTVDGSQAAPSESVPNRTRTGRRIPVTPGSSAAPMPPPPRPADEAQQVGEPKSLLPKGGDSGGPPSKNDGTLGSSALDWVKSEKGQDLSDWLLNFGLGTMAAASQPGATALGAMGVGGLQAQQQLGQRQDRRENRQLRKETQKENAELRRATIAQQGEIQRERNQIQREAIEQRRDAAADREESRRQSRELTAAVRASGRGDDDLKREKLQLERDKAADRFRENMAKDPNATPEAIDAETARRHPKSTIGREFQTRSLDADLSSTVAAIRNSALPQEEKSKREAEARRRYDAALKRINGD